MNAMTLAAKDLDPIAQATLCDVEPGQQWVLFIVVSSVVPTAGGGL